MEKRQFIVNTVIRIMFLLHFHINLQQFLKINRHFYPVREYVNAWKAVWFGAIGKLITATNCYSIQVGTSHRVTEHTQTNTHTVLYLICIRLKLRSASTRAKSTLLTVALSTSGASQSTHKDRLHNKTFRFSGLTVICMRQC